MAPPLLYDEETGDRICALIIEGLSLRAICREHPEMPALITLHHHPVDIGTDWMANIGLKNREDFWQLVDRFPQVKIVLWGHIHQTHEQQRNGVQLLATPSTCIQFAPNSQNFKLDHQAPGYRWFDFYADGRFQTGISRLQGIDLSYDKSSTGY